MKRAPLAILSGLAAVGGIALAHGADNPLAQPRACGPMEREGWLECLDKLSPALTPASPARTESSWIVSLTTSPVDYAPIATGTAASREVAGELPLQLSIRCRSGRSEFAISGPAISGRAEDYVISYSAKGGPPVQIAAATPAFGAGIAFKVDTGALFQSLPSEGDLVVYIGSRLGPAKQATFSLLGLEAVRAKIAGACKWPHAVAKPNS
jgi:hypothetical protein